MGSCNRITSNVCFVLAFLVFFSANNSELIDAADTLLPAQSMKDGHTLVSANQTFELGFFSPGNSSSRYVGIWYLNINPQTVVWIANRESPVVDTSGVLAFDADGKLVIIDGRGSSFEVASASASTNMVATILDTGSLVLKDGINSSQVLWQSFDYPTDTLLPSMTFGLTRRRNRLLTAWTSADDVAAGDFSMGGDPNGTIRFFVWQKDHIYWDSGLWNGKIFSNIPELAQSGMYYVSYSIRNNEDFYFRYTTSNDSVVSRWVLSSSGKLQQLVWAYNEWLQFWAVPKSQCDVYDLCGDFGVCFEGNLAHCQCLMGFQPASEEDWNHGVTRGGCLRNTGLQCNKTQGSQDGFLQLNNMKLPADVQISNASMFECQSVCLSNCSCTAFALGESCQLWHGDLKDLQQLDDGVKDKAGTLYLRLAASELGGKKRRLRTIVMATVIPVMLLLVFLLSFWLITRYRGKRNLNKARQLLVLGTDIARKLDEESGAGFTMFGFSNVADATQKFSTENKLGEGGFGPVYKGQLPQGQEIAVKRLSTWSGQGLEEFKNEILLIAKLQHRNLVRLLGCCIQREEKILVYEYMPNKSLDFFLFDPKRRAQLDWKKRLHIIEGIAQGLLYLHKHSRLRIIHRDLKASNILLDGDMNPKISDFGMARIFSSNEIQANTNRVVGTYGYMSPEYASEGLFSIKSDVFSFGVLLLEIVSGKRNAGFHQYGNSLNLLGYAWELWNQGKWLELIDPSSADNCPTAEIQKCIHISLLCVQESAADRPTMSDVITMLNSEGVTLPEPKHPAFFNLRMVNEADLSSNKPYNCSVNDMTITAIDGR